MRLPIVLRYWRGIVQFNMPSDMITGFSALPLTFLVAKHLIKIVVLIFELVCSYYPDNPS